MRLLLSKHRLFAPVLLVGIILAVYLPAVQSGIHPIDDPGIISRYSSSLSLSQIFLSGSSYYYRPIVEFSFWLDNFLWGLEPHTMHLENVLLHCVNTLLLFVFVRKVIDTECSILIPFTAALLFALHPVNVEAVAWIAGRTDPLLTLFVLATMLCWLNWLNTPDWVTLSVALALYSAALLSKETALVVSAVLILFSLAWPGAATVKQRRTVVVILAVLVVAIIIVFVLVVQGGTGGLGKFMYCDRQHVIQIVQGVLISLGFYLKKLVVPFPLNFAIDTVSSWYAVFGLLFFPMISWLFRQQRKAALLFCAATFCILPASILTVKPVAWTPFAERYLYLTSAFFVVGLSVSASALWDTHKKVLALVAMCLVPLFFVVSLQRTMLWNDKLAFFQDTAAKSPKFGSVYYSLGGVLAQNGDIVRASEAFHTAEQFNQRASMRYPIKAAIMWTLLAQGENLKVKDYFLRLFPNKQDAPADFLELLYKADIKRLAQIAENDKYVLATDLLETLILLDQKQPDPFWLYQSGRMALIASDTSKAAEFFRRAYSKAPLDAHYREASLINLRRLEQGK